MSQMSPYDDGYDDVEWDMPEADEYAGVPSGYFMDADFDDAPLLEDFFDEVISHDSLALMQIPGGYYTHNYRPQGSNWLAELPPEERKAFAQVGYRHALHYCPDLHSRGGIARSKSAARTKDGKFQ